MIYSKLDFDPFSLVKVTLTVLLAIPRPFSSVNLTVQLSPSYKVALLVIVKDDSSCGFIKTKAETKAAKISITAQTRTKILLFIINNINKTIIKT